MSETIDIGLGGTQHTVRYWLHRISHEWDVSSYLLSKGYLTIGWAKMASSGITDRVMKNSDRDEFEKIMSEYDCGTSRSRFSLFNFCLFQKRDIVLVPLYAGEFSLYRITERPVPVYEISGLKELLDDSDCDVFFDSKSRVIRRKKGDTVDIGFAVPVAPLKENLLRREYADNKLSARMKMRQTNGSLMDFSKQISDILCAEAPINLYANIMEQLAEKMLEVIKNQLTDDKFEKLIKWYFGKIGGTRVYIDSKNKSGKKDGADADIIAEFDVLRVVFFIQAKLHKGTTSQWAVEQIMMYKSQFDGYFDEYTCIPWVISTADKFSDEALKIAHDNKVRLVNGLEFARMLIDAGITDINDAFEP